ncbi:MAG: hypothetical protein K5694_00225 [Bacilli bacterium]|nr:hypothetical protein [Bacilli bacterium]
MLFFKKSEQAIEEERKEHEYTDLLKELADQGGLADLDGDYGEDQF